MIEYPLAELPKFLERINNMGWNPNKDGGVESSAALFRGDMDTLTAQAAKLGLDTSEISSGGGYKLILSPETTSQLRAGGATFPSDQEVQEARFAEHVQRPKSLLDRAGKPGGVAGIPYRGK